jgi:hypothetical protein
MPPFTFRQTEAAESLRVREFLAGVFGTSIDAPSLRSDLIRWKYYDARPDWPGSRSYVLERGGEFVAHGCVWPMRLYGVNACQIIDWAGAPKAVGAGLLLRREVEKLVTVSVGIGGSEDSRKVMPRAGYQTVTEFRTFVRVLRPLRQFGRRTERTLFLRAAKTARAWMWSLAPVPRVPTGWSVEVVTRFRDDDVPLRAGRSPELLTYLMACPAVRMHGYVLRKSGQIAGQLLLAEVDGQDRIADLQLTAGEREDWAAAVGLATRVAAENGASEVVAHSSFDGLSDALRAAGYRERGSEPVFVKAAEVGFGGKALHITPADYDDFFALAPGQPFAT